MKRMIGPNTGALDTPTMKSPATEEPEAVGFTGAAARQGGLQVLEPLEIDPKAGTGNDLIGAHFTLAVGPEHEAARPGPPLDTRYALSRHPITGGAAVSRDAAKRAPRR
jgi:hypothetical protein